MRERRPTSTSNFGVGRRESHDATAFYERFQPPELSARRRRCSLRSRSPSPFVCGDARAMDDRRRRLGRARRHVAAVLRRQAVRGGARARRRAELVPRVPRAAARRVRRVRAQARARRPHRGQRRQPRAQALPQPVGRRHRASCRTTSACCCAARSSGRRARARAARARGDRSAARRTPCCATSPSGSSIASKGRFDRARSRRSSEAARGCPSEHDVTTDDFMALTLDVWEIAAGERPPRRPSRARSRSSCPSS